MSNKSNIRNSSFVVNEEKAPSMAMGLRGLKVSMIQVFLDFIGQHVLKCETFIHVFFFSKKELLKVFLFFFPTIEVEGKMQFLTVLSF